VSRAFEYVGTELHLFKGARNWKRYLRARIEPYVRGDVLEVGAGIGGTTAVLHDASCASWTCLEPDARLAQELIIEVGGFRDARGVPPKVVTGALSVLDRELKYDCLLYIDVLEHIDDDRGELTLAVDRLRPGGHLVVVAPAHQWLFSPFDRAVGHFRRYDRRMLRERSPAAAQLVQLEYLDSVGIAASLGNRLLMRASNPSKTQIAIWDHWMVPVSRVIDPWLAFALGKTVFAVWRR
jgi:2-polyprenyl-3-methyl-5-hydroxy-6-metoxy-1,4-benzoquinol methylase